MKAIINAHVCTMDGCEYENGYIITEGRKIKEVGPMNDFDGAAEIVLDANGQVAVPGLIDAHCHVGLYETGAGDADICDSDTPLCQSFRAVDAINPQDCAFAAAKAEGVTTVVTGPGSISPIGGQFAAIKTEGTNVDEMVIKAPCAMKMSLGENTRCFGSRMKVAAMIRKTLYAAKQYKESGKTFDFELAPLVPVLEGEMPVKFHVHRASDILTALRIAREFAIKISLEHATDADLVAEEIKMSGAAVCVGPLVTDKNKSEILRHDPSLCAKLYKKGIDFAIVTDHPELPVENLRRSMCLAVACGLPREAALEAVTANAAKAAGIENSVGRLRPGLDADIAVFSSHPCDFYAKCTAVFVNGEKVL